MQNFLEWHRILEGVNIDGDWLETLGLEEQAIQDVIQATTEDFACTIERLKRTPGNPNLLRHAYELVRFIQSDDSFCFMDMEPGTYIEMMLTGANLTVKDLLANAYHDPRRSTNTHGGMDANAGPDMAGRLPNGKGNWVVSEVESIRLDHLTEDEAKAVALLIHAMEKANRPSEP